MAGAHASARLYSLVQCAKANGLEPYAYLRWVFTELPRAQSLCDIEALLPTRLGPRRSSLNSTPGRRLRPRVKDAVHGAFTVLSWLLPLLLLSAAVHLLRRASVARAAA